MKTKPTATDKLKDEKVFFALYRRCKAQNNQKPKGIYLYKAENGQWYFYIDTDYIDINDAEIRSDLKRCLPDFLIRELYGKRMSLNDFFKELHEIVSPALENCAEYVIEADVYSIRPSGNMVFLDLTDDPNGTYKFPAIASAQVIEEQCISENSRVKCYASIIEYEPKGLLQLDVRKIFLVEDGMTKADQQRQAWGTDDLPNTARHAWDKPVPKKIGVISNVGKHDGYNDFVYTMSKKSPDTILVPKFRAMVAENIACAIAEFQDTDCDCICIVRGGTTNAHFDFLAFDHPKLLEAIKNSTKPVLTGIGNNDDVPACCKVAYCNASTPTALAYTITKATTKHEATEIVSKKSTLAKFFSNLIKIIWD